MSPIFVTSLLGILLSILMLGQVSPSVISTLTAKKADVGIAREALIMNQVVRYRAIEGAYPANMTDLISKNYWKSADNDNGFGGTYSFTVDATKNTIKVSTAITDSIARSMYMNNNKRAFRALYDSVSGAVDTVFIIPNSASFAGLPGRGLVTTSSVAPDAVTNTYWYDTSGTTAVLKISDGANWTAVQGGNTGSASGTIDPASLLSNASSLPTTANNGDVRYVLNSQTSNIETFYYVDGSWLQLSNGLNKSVITKLAGATLPAGQTNVAYSYSLASLFSVYSGSTLNALSINPSSVTWTLIGTLPAGMSMNASGVISGTPTASGVASISVVATYLNNSSVQSYSVTINAPVLLPPPQLTAMVTTGQLHACALTSAGAVKCWGYNGGRQLGNNLYLNSDTPVTALASGGKFVTANDQSNCVIMSDATMRCWGRNGYGQHGAGNTTEYGAPTAVAGITGISKVSLGYFHGCGIFVGGSVKCWGTDTLSGTIGDGTITSVLKAPTAVTGIASGATDISAGYAFSCAVVSGGVKCWGRGGSGQLGNNGYVNSSIPVQTIAAGSGVISVTAASIAGAYNACAVFNTGVMKCWGGGSQGQNATVIAGMPIVPTATAGTQDYVMATLGSYQGCGLTTNGAVRCWGANFFSTLGDGTQTSSNTPVNVVGLSSGATHVTTGYAMSCAQLSSGTVKCWGNNTGTGGIAPGLQMSSTPVVVF